ncbi:carbohydrate porin [Phormidium sp. LEGE 05292]|uniref:iron uptake porin n=1 Tax=[Phormidium] sp. LEGE 05292 TaxID=767427 RepID=UPI001881C10A|nr:iron uptake porin [Phormidium sp. LEGE 05292]MBE9227493.1 carbohydrate porin [Phormidium sp. LEGE 05292]
MNKFLWQSWLISPVIFFASGLMPWGAIAADLTENGKGRNVDAIVVAQVPDLGDTTTIDNINQTATDSPNSSELDQVTSVSQLRDVQPTDWAFQALQSLVERYGCIEGYPDRTYRGNRAMTRYEFAAGLNSCLDRIQELIAALPQGISKEDLDKLRRLQEEFAVELASMRGRVDALEARVSEVEANQFSTTTKLNGFVAFNFTTASIAGDNVKVEGFSGPPPIAMRDPATNKPMVRRATNPNTTMSGLAWLTLNTSFNGRDSLVTKLVAGNGNSPVNQLLSAGLFNTAGTPFFDQTAGVFANEVVLGELFYSFPVADNLRLTVGPRINWYLHFDFNPFTLPFTGANTFNAINSSLLTYTKRGAGAVVEWNISKNFEFRTAYLTESIEFNPGPRPAADPNIGLFNGADSITAELTIKPTPTANIRFLYLHSNLPRNPLGQIARQPLLGVADDGFGGRLHDASADTFGVNFDWLITKGFGIFGRYYYSSTNISPIDESRPDGNINAQNIQAGLAFPDLGKKGALATVNFVIPFDVLEGRKFLVAGGGNGGTQYEIGTTYFIPITPNIGIVPSLYVIGNINNFDDNPTVFVGNLQTEFRF